MLYWSMKGTYAMDFVVGGANGNIESVPVMPKANVLPFESRRCSAEQLRTIALQLPPEDCLQNQRQPWTSQCSFSRASSCPNHVWLEQVHSRASTNTSFVSYFVGCNKAIDAVETLHLGSGKNPKYDVDAWKQALINSIDSKEGKKAFAKSSCDQFGLSLERKQNGTKSFRPANVFCFEPVTATFRVLQKAKMTLGWHNELILEQAAVSNEPGTLFVPNNIKIGEEQKGMNDHQANCGKAAKDGGDAEGCLQVPVYTLNDYVMSLPQSSQQFSKAQKQIIHFLSIDVEGYDLEVLRGATSVLTEQVQYLEFEYNWKGPWGKSSLKEALHFLDENGFTCYWPGAQGELWKITGCWLDHYSMHFWSNVACVNRLMGEQARELAVRMEEIFVETLAKNDTIRY